MPKNGFCQSAQEGVRHERIERREMKVAQVLGLARL